MEDGYFHSISSSISLPIKGHVGEACNTKQAS